MKKAADGTTPAKREPQRSCVICRQRFAKRELTRHTCRRDQDGKAGLVADPRKVRPGRGFYVCGNEECVQRFEKYQGWRRMYKGVCV